jgi:hypothetical protein
VPISNPKKRKREPHNLSGEERAFFFWQGEQAQVEYRNGQFGH